MSMESDRNIVEQYNAMCRRATEGDPSARAVKFIIDAVLEDKLTIDQLRMISDANKKDGPMAAYELFLTFYKHSQLEEAAAI